MDRRSVGVVGAGRVGAVLAAKFRASGYPISAVSARSEASRGRASTMLPGVPVREPVEVAGSSDILVLAVPDDDLIAVAEGLAASGAIRAGQVVLHTSGRHGLEALAALTRLGARAIAFHPAMTFTGTAVDLARTCVYGLTAAGTEHDLAEKLAADLGGTTMWLAEGDRAIYHAALVHGANHLVTLVAQSMDLLRSAGADDPAAVLRPLLSAALDNALALGDAALTGPVVRGDITTIRAHVDAFSQSRADAATVDAYLAMARATAHRAEAAGRLGGDDARQVRHTLVEADWDAIAEWVHDPGTAGV